MDIVSKHRDNLFQAAKDHAKKQAGQVGRHLHSQAKSMLTDKLGDSVAAGIAHSAIDSVHSSFQAGLSGSGAEFNGIGTPKALPYVIMVAAPTPEEAEQAKSMGMPEEAIAGGAWAPFTWVKKTAESAIDKAGTVASSAVSAVKKEAGDVLNSTIKPLFKQFKPQIEKAVDKGANKLMDVGFNYVEEAIGAEVPEIVGPMKALGLDKKLKNWVEGKIDDLLNKGIEELMGSGAMLPGAGAMLPGAGAMLPGSGSSFYQPVTDHMSHPMLRSAFHPSMLRRAK
eukprot:SAG11_NODE_268_length_11447_cov_3.136135_6_plen_282_part_00